MSLPINPKSPIPEGETSVNVYGYTPWASLCIVSVVIFAVCLVAHVGYAVWAGVFERRRRSRGKSDGAELDSQTDAHLTASLRSGQIVTFETLFSFGCALEVVGYGFRTASSQNPFILNAFILNYFMIVVAPVLFSAAQYFCLSILLQYPFCKDLLPLSGRTILAIFVTADVVTIVVQIVGAALIGVSYSRIGVGEVPPLTPEQANNILRAGLSVQVFFITGFLLLLGLLLARLLPAMRRGSLHNKQVARLPVLLAVLTISVVFIYIRTVFRLVESAMGVVSAAMRDQALFAALETVPVFVAVVLWTVFPLHTLL